MSNYKPLRYSLIGGVETHIPHDAVLKTLYQPLSSTTGGLTFHDLPTGANYQIPSGKKFTILGFRYQSISGARRLITIYYSDDVDGVSDEEDVCIFSALSSGLIAYDVSVPFNENTTAVKYITMKVDNATNAPEIPILYGYETLI